MRTILMAAVGMALLFSASSIRAAEVDVVHEQGVFCDTVDQAKAFLKAWDGDNTTQALQQINAPAPAPKACGTAELLVVETNTFDTVENSLGKWLLVEIQVYAQIDETGTHPAPSPVTQYTARKISEPGISI